MSRVFKAVLSLFLHFENKIAHNERAIISRKEKGQNCSVPLRSTTQFSQIINAALFCAEYSRSIKGRCKGGTKKPGSAIMLNSPPKENTAMIPK
jgi:hypothetical protein